MASNKILGIILLIFLSTLGKGYSQKTVYPIGIFKSSSDTVKMRFILFLNKDSSTLISVYGYKLNGINPEYYNIHWKMISQPIFYKDEFDWSSTIK